jgi:hypothetical protein
MEVINLVNATQALDTVGAQMKLDERFSELFDQPLKPK